MNVKPHKKTPTIDNYPQVTRHNVCAESLNKASDLMLNVNSLLGCISYLVQTFLGISGGIWLAIIIIRHSGSWISELSEFERNISIFFAIGSGLIALYSFFLWLVLKLWKKLHETKP